jgi:hypothetical protein
MSSPRTCLTERQVAALFRHHLEWFLRERAALEARGFPKPIMPGHDGREPRRRGRPTNSARYDPHAIAAWFDLQMPPHLRPIATPQHRTEREIEEQRAAVNARLRANGARIIAGLAARRQRRGGTEA